jgi:hypothetical protein
MYASVQSEVLKYALQAGKCALKTWMDCWVALYTPLGLLQFFWCFAVAACCCTWNLIDEFTFTAEY